MIVNARPRQRDFLARQQERAVLYGRAPADGEPCTSATHRCANARQYGAVLNDCCRGHLRAIMAALQVALDSYGVTWWADYGTLLGAVRNPMTTKADYPWLDQERMPDGPLAPGIIPHDKDGDIGALKADWQALMGVRARLEREGFSVVVRNQSQMFKVRLSATNHTNVDVFTWMAMGPDRLTRARFINVDHYKGRHFPKAWLEPMGTVEWEGLTLPAPADPVAFCAFRYGGSWRTPVAANHDGVRRG